MGKVVHLEISTDHLARAKEFYNSVFERQLQDMQGNGPSPPSP
jgi:predicted enzyme related to lactoylglutathione lyase